MLTNLHLRAPWKAETKFRTDNDMTQEKINRINELARKQKSIGLTEQEKQEQYLLRREYIESFKQSLIGQLENTYIVEPDGTKRKVTRKDENISN